MCACDRTQDLIGVVPKCLKAELYKRLNLFRLLPSPQSSKSPLFWILIRFTTVPGSQKGQKASILHSQITRYHQTVPRACLEKCTAVSLATSQAALMTMLRRSAPIAYAWRKAISHAYHGFKKVFFFLLFF